MKHITLELENKLKARIEWQNDKLKEAQEVHGENSPAVQRLHGYVGALRWVLEQAGCEAVNR